MNIQTTEHIHCPENGDLQELDSELSLLTRVYTKVRTELMPLELQKRIEHLIGAPGVVMIMRLADRIMFALYKEKSLKYCEWVNYHVGFTGNGPTLFDTKPEHSIIECSNGLPRWYKKRILRDFAIEKIRRQNIWKDVLERYT